MSCTSVNIADYCAWNPSVPGYIWIGGVHIEDQDLNVLLDTSYASGSTDGHRDATDQIINCSPGDVLTISVTVDAVESYWETALSWGHDIDSVDLVTVADLVKKDGGCPYTHTYTWTVPEASGAFLISWWINYLDFGPGCGDTMYGYGERQNYTLCIESDTPIPEPLPLLEWAWVDYVPGAAKRQPPHLGEQIFPVKLTADGLDDLVLSVSSITIRMRHISPSYIRVTIPDPVEWTDQILARTGGEIRVYVGERYQESARWQEELIYANVQSVTLQDHLRLEISGTRYITQRGAQTFDLPNPAWIKKGRDSRYSVRAAFDFSIKPTDTVVLPNGDSFTINLITFVVAGSNAYMDMEGV